MHRNTAQIANASGASPSITLEPGLWNLFVTSTGWGSADVQISHDNNHWFDLEDADGIVNFTADSVQEINGGVLLRLWVNSYDQDINFVAKRAL